MAERCEVWERRPGGRWEVVYAGSPDGSAAWVARCRKRGQGARFAAPVEQVIMPLGTPPVRDETPTAVIM